MRILMGTDLEGVAGVSTFGVDTGVDGRGYARATRLLSEEINAAARGFLAAGATELYVLDGHGPGAVDFEALQPPVRLLHGRPLAPIQDRLRELGERVDAVAMIGQHARAGLRHANLNHTQSSATVDHYKLNGRFIGEIAQFALYYGAHGKPLIFLSGDRAACVEAVELVPGIVTACVKEGMGRNCVLTMTGPEARALIERQAAEALKAHLAKPLAPVAWPGPYNLEKRFFHTDSADACMGQPGYQRLDDQTVSLSGKRVEDIIYR